MSEAIDRITRLEETVAHQARIIEELSGELSGQWKVIEQIRSKLDRLTERFLTLEAAALLRSGTWRSLQRNDCRTFRPGSLIQPQISKGRFRRSCSHGPEPCRQ